MDRREQILARLLAISSATAGINVAYRNKPGINEADLDVVVICDGDEQGDERDPEGSRPTNAPRRVVMTPSIEITAGGPPETIGSTINGYRAKLIKAISSDPTLITLCLDRFGIRYLGCVSGSGLGSTMEANMVLNFAFAYRLFPDEL
ncbi:MAG TPA: hypothetical protein VK603_11755 [Candidatus Saccharimonadales bacterium]|nr:hypothetical protein [Candidatus Saccharimonadales bacterium]